MNLRLSSDATLTSLMYPWLAPVAPLLTAPPRPSSSSGWGAGQRMLRGSARLAANALCTAGLRIMTPPMFAYAIARARPGRSDRVRCAWLVPAAVGGAALGTLVGAIGVGLDLVTAVASAGFGLCLLPWVGLEAGLDWWHPRVHPERPNQQSLAQ